MNFQIACEILRRISQRVQFGTYCHYNFIYSHEFTCLELSMVFINWSFTHPDATYLRAIWVICFNLIAINQGSIDSAIHCGVLSGGYVFIPNAFSRMGIYLMMAFKWLEIDIQLKTFTIYNRWCSTFEQVISTKPDMVNTRDKYCKWAYISIMSSSRISLANNLFEKEMSLSYDTLLDDSLIHFRYIYPLKVMCY